ncbi:MAG TPA: hypothetical protein VH370_09850 [Humisphaera sp.]|jgi:hypothetical protein|nr:hypothetical protein [Humisphaera sp.]
MQQRNLRRPLIEPLESRQLLSGSDMGLGGWLLNHLPAPDAAVKADLAKIQTDQQKFLTDQKTLAPTLTADRLAVQTAIKALAPKLTPLQTTLKNDITKWQATILADFTAIRTDRGNATKETADQTKLKTDLTAAATAIKADQTAIQNLIDKDPGVIAARAKLTADSKALATDKATLAADFTQLQKDLKAQYGSKI